MSENATSNVFKIDASTESEAGFTMRPGWYVETSTGTKGPFKTKREATATVNETTKATKASGPAKGKGIASMSGDEQAAAVAAALAAPHRTIAAAVLRGVLSDAGKDVDPAKVLGDDDAIAQFAGPALGEAIQRIRYVLPLMNRPIPGDIMPGGKNPEAVRWGEVYAAKFGVTRYSTTHRKRAVEDVRAALSLDD